MESRFSCQDQYSRYKPARAALESSLTCTSMNPRFQEKQLMHDLNDRLAGFIGKVHHLENQNQQLEREIEDIRGKAKPASGLEEEYGPELSRLRQLVQEISKQKHQIEIEHHNLEEELGTLRSQHEQQTRGRSEAERNISLLKKEMNDAYQAKLLLDKKSQTLVDEIKFLKKNHEEELACMLDQIQSAQVSVKAHGFGDPGVTAALRDIRAQLEGHTVSDLQQVGETFRSQFAKLTEAAETKREALRVSQQEIQEFRRRLQAKNIELDCAKGTREALEKQLHDVEDRHKEELIHYQNTIKDLENELISCKFDMSAYLREYQDLLNVKMALDVEILSYRKLLCGEEARLSSMSDSNISLPYIYHQSPVYTLPCFSRPGAPRRRAEPQYKFVEEIITETTREIEMSEFEESGSEEMEGAKDEREERDKRDGGSGEGEEEGGGKDGGEEGGEQVSDSEQDQVGEEELVNGGPGEEDDAEEEEEEEEEARSDEKEGDSRRDLSTDSLEEEESETDKVTESLDEKLDVPSEEEETGEGQKDDAEMDKLKKPVDKSLADVFEGSDNTKDRRSDVQEEDKSPALAAETAEKTQAEKVPVSPKVEPKEMTESKAANIESKVAKSTQDATGDGNNMKDKESALKSDEKSLPEAEKKLSGASQSVPSEEKTNASVKYGHQGAAESSKDPKPKLPEADVDLKDPQGKSEKTETTK